MVATARAAGLRPGQRLRFWVAILRPFSYPASVVPVFVGTASAAREDFHPLVFVLALAGSVLIHAGTNVANDYYDYVRGGSSSLSMGSNRLLEQGAVTLRQVFLYMLALFLAGAACGLALVGIVGLPVLWIGLASVAGGFFYTAPPLSLAYRGLGEVAVFVYMGLIMVVASSYVQLERLDREAFLLAIPVGLLVTAILHVNNLRDLDEDRAHGKTTWITLSGLSWGRVEYLAMVAGAFIAVAALVAARVLPLTALVVALALPSAVLAARIVLRETDRIPLNQGLKLTARLHAHFGFLFTLGLLLGLL